MSRGFAAGGTRVSDLPACFREQGAAKELPVKGAQFDTVNVELFEQPNLA